MVYKFAFTKSAEKDLERICDTTSKRILGKIKGFLHLRDPLSVAKKLIGFDLPTYRFRVGNYRVVFRINEKSNRLVILLVIRI